MTMTTEERLDMISAQVDRVAADVAEVHRALTGNGFGINRGLVGCVQLLEEDAKKLADRVDSLEERWDRLRWTFGGIAAGAGIASGGAIVGIVELVKHLGG